MVGIRLFPFGARPIFRGELLVSGKLTWKPKMEVEGAIFRFYVNFLGW